MQRSLLADFQAGQAELILHLGPDRREQLARCDFQRDLQVREALAQILLAIPFEQVTIGNAERLMSLSPINGSRIEPIAFQGGLKTENGPLQVVLLVPLSSGAIAHTERVLGICGITPLLLVHISIVCVYHIL